MKAPKTRTRVVSCRSLPFENVSRNVFLFSIIIIFTIINLIIIIIIIIYFFLRIFYDVFIRLLLNNYFHISLKDGAKHAHTRCSC